MDFYEKFLNQNILESLCNEEIEQEKIENNASKLSKSYLGTRSNSTFVKSSINISRVSPMLRSVIQND